AWPERPDLLAGELLEPDVGAAGEAVPPSDDDHEGLLVEPLDLQRGQVEIDAQRRRALASTQMDERHVEPSLREEIEEGRRVRLAEDDVDLGSAAPKLHQQRRQTTLGQRLQRRA